MSGQGYHHVVTGLTDRVATIGKALADSFGQCQEAIARASPAREIERIQNLNSPGN